MIVFVCNPRVGYRHTESTRTSFSGGLADNVVIVVIFVTKERAVVTIGKSRDVTVVGKFEETTWSTAGSAQVSHFAARICSNFCMAADCAADECADQSACCTKKT